MTQESQKSNTVLVIVAIIGAVGAITVAIISAYSSYKNAQLAQDIELTRIALTSAPQQGGTTQTLNIFTQNFDGSDGSFDSNVWICGGGSCSAQNIFQQNGKLVLQFINSEIPLETKVAFLKSESTWKMQDLVAIQANLQISPITKGGTFFGLNESSGCALFAKPDIDTPFVHCGLDNDYTTNDLQVKFDTWYTIRIEYDPATQELKYYLDDELIGRNKPKNLPNLTSATIGAWREPNQSVVAFIDNIAVRIRP